jgi:hypothetical protein
MEMKTLGKYATLAMAALMLGGLGTRAAMAEPLLTVVGFAKAAYDDRAGNEIVVKITRVDQDPATENEPFAVDCVLAGGNAIENQDYRFAFNGAVWNLGRVTFPPGVHELAFTIHTTKTPGPNKTLQLSLSNPSGPASVVTGDNPVTTITIVNSGT